MTLFAGTCGAGVLRLFVCRGLGRAALLRLFDFVESYEELGYYLNVYRDLGGAGIFVSICLLIDMLHQACLHVERTVLNFKKI